MVDFGELARKAEGLVAEHSEKIKDGVEKVGEFVGNKIGHDKVDPIEDKVDGFVDGIAAKHKPDVAGDASPATPPQETPPA
ncbi:antitoxin [Nakamurella sp. YIM 132087]|uniref:Antitoxin n=1 Tax=Nakamurella alba TaxID=2665158 RepID=A0A7K1FQ15_9ACTN|nr:Rv0909 family putative TA system antitoxin [Nakamurella alba]MTD15449.1 antitoxin [Nakamurella alba]